MCNKKYFNIIIISAIVLLPALYVSADVKVCPIFGDNMVIQRDANVPVWGWADKGQKITISGSWSDLPVNAIADSNGCWKAIIKTPKAGGPYEIKISGGNELIFKNVLAGEVWVCGGQSNMSFELSRCSNASTEIPKSTNPNVRFFKVISPESLSGQASDKRQITCQGQWLECNPESSAKFSGVGYFFGTELAKAAGIPVGLIQVSVGGTPAATWMSQKYLKSDPDFEPILKAYADVAANYPVEKKKYDEKLKIYNDKKEAAKASGKAFNDIAPKTPLEPYYFKRPSALYNRYVAPIQPYGIKGVIWYQGEADSGRWLMYRKLFPALIKNWRNDWGQGDFPFLFVQYAGFDNNKANKWPLLRESQAIALSVPNTAMASAIDLGEPSDIHPPRKQPVGQRLALAARAVVYGEKIEYSGPMFKKMTINESNAVLEFTHTGSGLEFKNSPATGFEICGMDKKFVPADAVVKNQQVIVSSSKVDKPVAIRYAWHRYPQCSLYNKDGLPAPPFRTDDWTDSNMIADSASASVSKPESPNNINDLNSVEITIEKDLDYLGSNRKEKLDMYYPAKSQQKKRPAVIIIHGGGLMEGDKAKNREINIATTLAKAGFVCASINYKLGTKSWPQCLYDCKIAVQYIRANTKKYNIDANCIGVIGGSAGGYLAALIALTADNPKFNPKEPYVGVSTSVKAVVDMYGISNLLTRQETSTDGEPNGVLKDGSMPKALGCGRNDCPELWKEASPVNHITKNAPPFLILHGTKDTTVDYKQSVELDAKLKENNVSSELHLLPGIGHTFDLQPKGHDLRPMVIKFFETHLK